MHQTTQEIRSASSAVSALAHQIDRACAGSFITDASSEHVRRDLVALEAELRRLKAALPRRLRLVRAA